MLLMLLKSRLIDANINLVALFRSVSLLSTYLSSLLPDDSLNNSLLFSKADRLRVRTLAASFDQSREQR
jgi:hypothetical protein